MLYDSIYKKFWKRQKKSVTESRLVFAKDWQGKELIVKGHKGIFQGDRNFHTMIFFICIMILVVVVTQPHTDLKTTVFLFEAMCEN